MSTETLTKPKTKIKKPTMYNVVLYNDEVTPFQYVIIILQTVFNKTDQEAYEITMNIHNTKGGVAGTYTLEIAKEKVKEVNKLNSETGLNLVSGIEPE